MSETAEESEEPARTDSPEYQRAVHLATRAASSLHMLLRNMRMYDADNAVFVEPLEVLRSIINELVARDGKFHLQVVGTVLGLNGAAIRVDFAALEMLRGLTETLKARGLGGIEVSKPLESHELKKFLRALAIVEEGADASGLSEVVGVRPARWAEMRAALDATADREIETSRKIDRNKYALTVAARAMTWLRRLLAAIDEGQAPPPLAPLNSVLRDLVDLSRARPRQLLRLARPRSVDEALLYQGVNTCLLSLVLGSELGFEREPLQDLGRAALLHEVGLRGTDSQLYGRHGAPLNEFLKAKLAQAPLVSARVMLRMRPLDASLLRSIVVVSEAKDAAGAEGEARPGPLARILRLASTFDMLTGGGEGRKAYSKQAALKLLGNELSKWFDQELVAVLANVLDEGRAEEPGR